MSFQFHYTPPPDEVVRNGQLATYALYTALLAIPKVWQGALIGGFGSAIITYNVVSHAGGEGAIFSMLLEPPMRAVAGALIGAAAAFAGQTAWRFFRRSRGLKLNSATQEEVSTPKPKQRNERPHNDVNQLRTRR